MAETRDLRWDSGTVEAVSVAVHSESSPSRAAANILSRARSRCTARAFRMAGCRLYWGKASCATYRGTREHCHHLLWLLQVSGNRKRAGPSCGILLRWIARTGRATLEKRKVEHAHQKEGRHAPTQRSEGTRSPWPKAEPRTYRRRAPEGRVPAWPELRVRRTEVVPGLKGVSQVSPVDYPTSRSICLAHRVGSRRVYQFLKDKTPVLKLKQLPQKNLVAKKAVGRSGSGVSRGGMRVT